jgi:hypothetical protein
LLPRYAVQHAPEYEMTDKTFLLTAFHAHLLPEALRVQTCNTQLDTTSTRASESKVSTGCECGSVHADEDAQVPELFARMGPRAVCTSLSSSSASSSVSSSSSSSSSSSEPTSASCSLGACTCARVNAPIRSCECSTKGLIDWCFIRDAFARYVHFTASPRRTSIHRYDAYAFCLHWTSP